MTIPNDSNNWMDKYYIYDKDMTDMIAKASRDYNLNLLNKSCELFYKQNFSKDSDLTASFVYACNPPTCFPQFNLSHYFIPQIKNGKVELVKLDAEFTQTILAKNTKSTNKVEFPITVGYTYNIEPGDSSY